MTRDVEADDEDDAYEERWERRSDSLSSAYDGAVYLNPAQRQLDEATRWYESHGRHAAVDHGPDDWEFASDVNRGRSRHREHQLHHSHDDVDAFPDAGLYTDLEEVPNLSRSFTTTASNRSSTRIDPLATEAESPAGQDMSDRGDIREDIRPSSPSLYWRQSPDPVVPVAPTVDLKTITGAVPRNLP